MCPSCGEPAVLGDRFCEACGTPLLRDGFLAVLDHECPVCGHPTEEGELRHCQRCDSSWTETNTRWGLDRGPVGAVSDRGLRRSRNEDACAVAVDGEQTALVVCDGVASTDDADLASAAAARAAIRELKGGFDDSSASPAPIIRAAQAAQCALSSEGVTGFPGCTTFVGALVRPGEVVVGNVGDSRAYLVGADGTARLLTVDDSWAREAVDSGLDEFAARSSSRAHEITAWLGAGSEIPEPHVAIHRTSFPGYLVACSDGLWEYVSSPEEMAALVLKSAASGPAAIARDLVEFALSSGGADNVTVAVARTGPPVTPQTNPMEERSWEE